jgi:hypothetical protein
MRYDELATTYAQMSDDELLELGSDFGSLTDDAQSALRAEFRSRKLDPPEIDVPDECDDTSAANEAAMPASGLADPVTVREYYGTMEAVMGHQWLGEAGIRGRIEPMLHPARSSSALPGFNLQVASADLERANNWLAAKERAAMPPPETDDYEGPTCPACHSTEVAMEADEPLAMEDTRLVKQEFYLPDELRIASLPDVIARWKCMACGHAWQEVLAEED